MNVGLNKNTTLLIFFVNTLPSQGKARVSQDYLLRTTTKKATRIVNTSVFN